jgi:hypothetical protein
MALHGTGQATRRDAHPDGPGGRRQRLLRLVVDNLSILAFIATVLIGVFGFPADVVYQRMFPGTALGVLVGNALYTWMALRLGRREGRGDVTAMPLGPRRAHLDRHGAARARAELRRVHPGGLDATEAALRSWRSGMAALVVMGALKLVLSFAGDWAGRAGAARGAARIHRRHRADADRAAAAGRDPARADRRFVRRGPACSRCCSGATGWRGPRPWWWR